MGEYYFGDELDKYGNTCRNKLADCAFTKVRPGDIIGVHFHHVDAEGWRSNAGMLFVKIVSAKMPAAEGFFSGRKGGQVTVELPNGQKCDLLAFYDAGDHYRSSTHYNPSKAICDHFNAHCYPQFECHGANFLFFAGKDADLKDAMVKEKQRRARRKQELEEEAQRRQAAQAARAREEAARRASVNRRELDSIFSGMNDLK